MDDVARMPAQDRRDLFTATAQKRRISAIIVEKDFWVCWILKRLFSMPDLPAELIFKGGTSLSKVYRAIERFSEDVDLSINRHDLGFGGDLALLSGKKQKKWIKELTATTAAMIRDDLSPRLSAAIEAKLGVPAGVDWRLELDTNDKDRQTILFHYPSSGAPGSNERMYVRPNVRLEMGARGEAWPFITGCVIPYAAEEFPAVFRDAQCFVRAATAERTFWEKATILHTWFHGEEKSFKDRQSRHYYDVVRLYEHGIGKNALKDPDLLRSVSAHKSLYFACGWAKYKEAVPGTLRLAPPESRIPELKRDYQLMREEMIFGHAPAFEHLMTVLEEIEGAVNS